MEIEEYTQYIAEDGTEFPTEETCLKYESYCLDPDDDSLILLDISGKVLPVNFDNICDDDCRYIQIKNKKALDYILFLVEDWNLEEPLPTECGTFYYDVELDEWEDIQELIDITKLVCKNFNIDLNEE